jgi:predicted nucleic acid-binding protein
LDTDVILDLVLERDPFVAVAVAPVDAHEHKQFDAYIAPSTLINVFYIIRKLTGAVIAHQASSGAAERGEPGGKGPNAVAH